MAVETESVVVSNRKIQSVYFKLEIRCPPIAQHIEPGQFVMLRVAQTSPFLLRRPFSVYRTLSTRHPDGSRKDRLVIIYKKVGKGTEKMTALEAGETVDLIGPLGNGFRLPPLPSSASVVLIGGGVGIVSLYSLGETLKAGHLSVFVGGRTRQDVLCVKDFARLEATVFTATEDGSLGFKGTVIDLFRSEKRKFEGDGVCYVYACGPMAMLKELSKAVRSKRFISQGSLETRMACGFGACYGCVVKTRNPETPYLRVCKEGPVFDLSEIVWE